MGDLSDTEKKFIKYLESNPSTNQGPRWLIKRGWTYKQETNNTLWSFTHSRYAGTMCYTEAWYREIIRSTHK